MDLNQALETCRGGFYIRDDLNMAPDWVVYYDKKLKSFFYINPKTGPAYEVTFRDAMKASYAWRAMSHPPTRAGLAHKETVDAENAPK